MDLVPPGVDLVAAGHGPRALVLGAWTWCRGPCLCLYVLVPGVCVFGPQTRSGQLRPPTWCRGPSTWWPGSGAGARRPRYLVRALVAVDLVAVDLVAAALVPGPWCLVRAPWWLQVDPGPGEPKKRAGSPAARALALFHTLGFT